MWRKRVGMVAAVAVAMAVVPGCSSGGEDEPLSPIVAQGREAAKRLGCAACHADDGTGVEDLGPPWVGLFGSTVQLEDGTTTIADRAYIERAILEPDTQRVTGFTLPMPPYRLEEEDLKLLLDYIEASK